MPRVDAVVVSYNSADHLRGCVEPLSAIEDVAVTVVDNDSADHSLASIAGLRARTIETGKNVGFSAGNNIGWREGTSPYVLFLNPDARIDVQALDRLVAVLEREPRAGLVAPRIVGEHGEVHHSLRRFPRLRSTYAQALFVHKLAPTASWADEIIRDEGHYERPGPQEWVSGACMLVRRDVLERLGGWDEGFFLYCEDIDLCRRIRDLGLEVLYEPRATARHVGGGSAPRTATLPVLAASRVRYARLHQARHVAFAERLGIALEALTRVVAGRGGGPARAGHARSLRVALTSRF